MNLKTINTVIFSLIAFMISLNAVSAPQSTACTATAMIVSEAMVEANNEGAQNIQCDDWSEKSRSNENSVDTVEYFINCELENSAKLTDKDGYLVKVVESGYDCKVLSVCWNKVGACGE